MVTTDAARIVPKAKRIKFNDPVRIEVGVDPDCEIFNTTAEILTTRSAFFRKALSTEWKEGRDRVIKLPEDSADIFSLYMHLLHTGELAVRAEQSGDSLNGHEEYTLTARLYVLAEKLQDVKTKNIIVEATTKYSRDIHVGKDGKRMNWLPSLEHINIIYSGTATSSRARRLLVNMYVYDKTSACDHRAEAWHREFVGDFAAKLLTHRQKYQTGEARKGKDKDYPGHGVEKIP